MPRVGNLIDSMFYGDIEETLFSVAQMSLLRLCGFLHGRVVDSCMFLLSEMLISPHVSFVVGKFNFQPIFNIADLLFQLAYYVVCLSKRFLKNIMKKKHPTVETNTEIAIKCGG